MSILIDEKSKVLIQGITGKTGRYACAEMLRAGTDIQAGVTPGKGGTVVDGVPVYNTVSEAVHSHPDISFSLVAVPARAVRSAAVDAIEAGILVVNILAEGVSPMDASCIVAFAKERSARVIGPSSVGIISPGKAKSGIVGTGSIHEVFVPGPIGVISKSGGMTAEVSLALSRNGFGQSTVIGIGGDIILGSSYADLLPLFEEDLETEAVVIIGEIGGTYEEEAADLIESGAISKPVVALISGKFTETLPSGTVLGHAGAIVSKGKGGYDSKISALQKAGVILVGSVEEIPEALARQLER